MKLKLQRQRIHAQNRNVSNCYRHCINISAKKKTNNKTIFIEYFERKIVIVTRLHAYRRRCYSRVQTRIEPAGYRAKRDRPSICFKLWIAWWFIIKYNVLRFKKKKIYTSIYTYIIICVLVTLLIIFHTSWVYGLWHEHVCYVHSLWFYI